MLCNVIHDCAVSIVTELHLPRKMEEDFREASCIGNIEAVKKLLNHGVNINSQNAVNGWYVRYN